MATKIVGYRGLANRDKVIIRGHVFEKHKVKDVHPKHHRFKNLKQSLRRFRLKPMKHAEIVARIEGDLFTLYTDERGFFSYSLDEHTFDYGWHKYQLRFPNSLTWYSSEFYFPDEHETGVISDVDDTVLVSHSYKLWKKLSLVMLKNAYSRKTIPYIHHWQQHITDLNEKLYPKDYFYVSNSEWNLYDFLIDFFEINSLPKGVFLLQNLKKGVKDLLNLAATDTSHKFDSIKFLMGFYSQKDYILIGDSGQKDMEIYSKIAKEYPDRIKGVIIRQLSKESQNGQIAYYRVLFNDFGIPFLVFH